MTQPRAADDFPMIRSRMEDLRRERNRANVTRPRAADDFATIRARMEELRRERTQMLTDQKGRSPIGPRPYYRAREGVSPERITPRSISGCSSGEDAVGLTPTKRAASLPPSR
jgi:hypothetical protein